MFDREYEFNKIISAINDGVPLIVVTGIHRVGKTTLVKVLLNEINIPIIHTDARTQVRKFR
ncbi:ATP-binding protein [Pyrococcus sp. ST04]|uniref:ATP-binding protein n=1 Tax=Pyrococcus sp. ST04 TaxID=1183377 RepID=UPI00064F3573|nr:ATP-binding protein [Pyrococcus sp. ST04]